MRLTIRWIQTAVSVSALLALSAGAGTFQTAVNDDFTAPVLTTAPKAQPLKGGLMAITWTTNEVSDSRVYWGTSAALLPQVAGDIEDYTQSHEVRLSKLSPSTTYFYQVVSVDPVGNTLTSPVYNFSTSSTVATSPVMAIGPDVDSPNVETEGPSL